MGITSFQPALLCLEQGKWHAQPAMGVEAPLCWVICPIQLVSVVITSFLWVTDPLSYPHPNPNLLW